MDMQSQVLAEVERMQKLCPGSILRPFGLGVKQSLEQSGRRISSQIKKLAVLTGAGHEAGEKMADVVVSSSRRKRPREKQTLEPIQNVDDVPNISSQQGHVGDVVVAVQNEKPEFCIEKPTAYKRTVRDSATLEELVKVVEYALSLPDDAAKQKLTRARFPSVLKSNILSKRVSKYFKYQLWKMPCELRNRLRSVPNWHIQICGLNVPERARSTICGVPKPVASMVNKAMLQNVQGLTQATKRPDPAQGPYRLNQTLSFAVNEYNSKIEDQSVEIQASNKRAWTDFEQSISPQDSKKKVADKIRHLKARVRKCPKKIVFKPNRNTFKRFNRAMGNVH